MRYLAIVRYLGLMDVVFGGLMIVIDLHAGMPPLWVAAEGPPLIGVGCVVLWLSRSL